MFLCAVANILSPTTPCDMNHNAATTEMSEVWWRGKGGHDLAVDNVATGGEEISTVTAASDNVRSGGGGSVPRDEGGCVRVGG